MGSYSYFVAFVLGRSKYWNKSVLDFKVSFVLFRFVVKPLNFDRTMHTVNWNCAVAGFLWEKQTNKFAAFDLVLGCSETPTDLHVCKGVINIYIGMTAYLRHERVPKLTDSVETGGTPWLKRPIYRYTDAGSSPRYGKGFFSQSRLVVQTLLRCPYSSRVKSQASTCAQVKKQNQHWHCLDTQKYCTHSLE